MKEFLKEFLKSCFEQKGEVLYFFRIFWQNKPYVEVQSHKKPIENPYFILKMLCCINKCNYQQLPVNAINMRTLNQDFEAGVPNTSHAPALNQVSGAKPGAIQEIRLAPKLRFKLVFGYT